MYFSAMTSSSIVLFPVCYGFLFMQDFSFCLGSFLSHGLVLSKEMIVRGRLLFLAAVPCFSTCLSYIFYEEIIKK